MSYSGDICASFSWRVWSASGCLLVLTHMSVTNRSRSPEHCLTESLHSRRNVIKHGALVLGAMALPMWPMRRARAQSVTTFDYYISPSGSDSNPGTQAAPWAITAINTKQSVYAGKKVGLLDGTYSLYSACQAGAWNHAALVVNGGTASSPTLIAAVNPQKAILDAHNPSTGAYPTSECAIIGVGQGDSPPNLGNFIIDGLVITGSNTFGITIHGQGSGTINNQGGASGVVVRNCEIYDITSISFGDNPAAVNPSYLTGFLLQNCLIHPIENGNTAQVCGLVSFNTLNNIYEYNTIYNATMAMEEKEGPQGGTTVRYCYLEGNSSSWATVKDFAGGRPGQVTTFHHCIIVGQSPWENGDATNSSNASQESLVCYNCTFYYGGGNFSTSGLVWQSWGSGNSTSPAATETLYNNIYYATGSGSSGSDVLLTPGTILLSNYNCYQPAATSIGELYLKIVGASTLTGDTLSVWRAATGQDVNSIAANPGFVKPTAANPAGYQLASGSPCVGAGRVGGVSSGAACNMGAWDGTVTQIGCDFASGVASSGSSLPDPPVLSVS